MKNLHLKPDAIEIASIPELSIPDLWKYLLDHPYQTVQYGEHVLISSEDRSVKVSSLSIRWFGQEPRIVVDPNLAVGKIDITNPDGKELLREAGRTARHRRLSRFRRCSQCHLSTPPESISEGLCHACFEIQGGVH